MRLIEDWGNTNGNPRPPPRPDSIPSRRWSRQVPREPGPVVRGPQWV